jgi:hypothetical protein
MINRKNARRFVEKSIRAVLAVAIGVGCIAPAYGQDCATEFSQPGGYRPLPGIASFSASVSVAVSAQYSCGGVGPCGGTVLAQSTATHGRLDVRCCPAPHPQGGTCWSMGFNALRWGGNYAETGGVVIYSSLYNGGFTSQTSFTADIALLRPVAVVASVGATVTGGRVVNGNVNGTRLFHAGETVTLASNGTLVNQEGYFEYAFCPDTDLNGICDGYDNAARAFGDFDSSGSVDGVDLAALLSAWGTAGSVCDISDNGVVDGGDLAFLLSRWGQGA